MAKVIVGLGNPGARYNNTRHNIGFRVLDAIAARAGTPFTREKYKAAYAEAHWAHTKLLLLKPQTYMNASGESVALVARNNVNDPDDLLIVYDDFELPLGRIRLRAKGSAGTHNGMRSVVERLGHQDIPRLRIGVGGGERGAEKRDYVLSRFRPDELETVERIVERAADAALEWTAHGIEHAMNAFNRAEGPDADTPPET